MGVSLLGLKSGRLEVFRKLFTIGLVATFFVASGSAFASNPTEFDFEFSGNGGAINDFAVQWFFADPYTGTNSVGSPDGAANLQITYLELEIVGLTHTSPMDLNIYLLDPFGTGIEIIDDRGDQHGINNFTLVFSDKGVALPTEPDPLINNSMYTPEMPGTPGSFSDYTTTGNDEWRLVVIDDSRGDDGYFEGFTLRGLVVPEPATLSLLAIGACALIRRRKA